MPYIHSEAQQSMGWMFFIYCMKQGQGNKLFYNENFFFKVNISDYDCQKRQTTAPCKIKVTNLKAGADQFSYTFTPI